ncbi:MAG: TIGR03936 family radical SAM-associated protein [Chloroflexota bacterium]
MRIRITFSKTEAMRYTGHLDLHRAWERTFRRAALPIAYSQGFHPQPRFSLAAALPLGFTSECEVADAWLAEELPLEEILAGLKRAAPPGIDVHAVQPVDERAPALQTQVNASEYRVTVLDPVQDLPGRVSSLLAADRLLRERRGKSYDLRPLVEDIQVAGGNTLLLRLAAREGATGRPEEVLAVLSIPAEAARIHRKRLLFAPG